MAPGVKKAHGLGFLVVQLVVRSLVPLSACQPGTHERNETAPSTGVPWAFFSGIDAGLN